MASKYYTAFAWDMPIDMLHCTHKYLGELSDEDADEVETVLKDFFGDYVDDRPVMVAFTTKEVWTASGVDFKVLLAPDGMQVLKRFSALRADLNEFKEDDFEYRPHVTTEFFSGVEEPFTRYVLVRDGVEVLDFPLVAVE